MVEMEAFSFSLLSMASTSTLVTEKVGSSAKLVGRLAAERLLALQG